MKAYIVEAHSYDEDHRLAVCASIDKAKEILKAKAEELIEDGDYQIDWDLDGLGFDDWMYDYRYDIVTVEVLE